MKPLTTCMIAGMPYLLHPQKLGTIQETIHPDALVPVTLLDSNEIYGDVESTLRQFRIVDDVYHGEFAFVLVEKPAPNGSEPAPGRAARAAGEAGAGSGAAAAPAARRYSLEQAADPPGGRGGGFARLPSGPYFLHGPNLYQAWKLYDDALGAFALGVIPQNLTGDGEGFRPLTELGAWGAHRAVAVPSRLYHGRPTPERPLSGMRVAVPDAVALRGVPSALSSRAWQALRGAAPAADTAPLARRLLALGAVVVGVTKASPLAGGGADWVDELPPWNPRADGYQRPEGGEAGAAAAVAGYGWLQAAFGLDGLGSLREPAAAQGLFSLRTTPGAVSLDGAQSRSPDRDSVGLVSRSVGELLNTTAALLGRRQPPSSAVGAPPSRLVYPVDLAVPAPSNASGELTQLFIGVLESELGFEAETVNVSALWAKHPPPEARGRGLAEYVKKSMYRSLCYDFYKSFDKFRQEYRDRFHSDPFQDRSVKKRWRTGKNVTETKYKRYQKRIAIFRQWFSTHVASADDDGGGWTAVVLPMPGAAPRYRDEPLRHVARSVAVPSGGPWLTEPGGSSAPTRPDDVGAELLPLLLQTPQMTVPFAQLPYMSRITGRREFRAVSASVGGPRGSDEKLVGLVQRALVKARWRTHVDWGQRVFPEDDNARHALGEL